MQLHPNSRFLLNHVVSLFADQSFVKRAKEDYGSPVRPAKSMKSTARSRGCCRGKEENCSETLHEELADLGLDEEELFFDGLTALSHRDALFACSMLVLALMLDGRVGRRDWLFIQRAAASVRPPLEARWSNTVYLTNTCRGIERYKHRILYCIYIIILIICYMAIYLHIQLYHIHYLLVSSLDSGIAVGGR